MHAVDAIRSRPEPTHAESWGPDAPVRRARADEQTRPLDIPWPRRHPFTGRLLSHAAIRIDERYAEGGTGIIYRATRSGAGLPLAVKVLRPDCPNARGSIRREVEVLREVSSPWVARMEDAGMLEDGRRWLAMELLEGPSLAELPGSRRRIDRARVLRWLRQACLGLAAVHDAGWVHRDVKPSNLVLTRGMAQVVLIDFGIAERLGQRSPSLSGTPDYMAPEQARNAPADPRSDLYALACCAYELLTGRHLVPSGGSQEKIMAHLMGLTLDPTGLPPALVPILQRCLSLDVDQRPADARSLEAQLAWVQARLDRRFVRARTRHQPPRPRHEDTTCVMGPRDRLAFAPA
ncbi:MAG: serine/threonine protein kinase [Myxococcales bacterium]|nr:serine/threonine protein kinase [Myxococcales bacterium]MCB9716684.1 serine/threonine protein kinase [Myxococcales bacterium]